METKEIYKLKKLPNGLRILTVPGKNTETFTLLVLVATGSKYESKKINGISHFLEHMFFKGTEDRPDPGQVHRELDGIGAQHNAFTSKEVTGYWVKAAGEHFDLVLDVVSDILTEPLLDAAEIEKEKGVIIQEIRMRNDDPRSRVNYIFERLLWGDQPAGWEIAGDEPTIRAIQRKDIEEYFYSQYSSKNTIVVASGALPKNIENKIARAFSSLRKGNPAPKKHVKNLKKERKIIFEKKDNEASNFILGFEGFSLYDPKRFVLEILGTILGGNTSSRLFMEVREKLGLAYYVGAGNTLYTDSGYFEISAGTPHNKVDKTVEVAMEEIKKIKTDGIKKEEIKKAVDYIKGVSKINLESSNALADFFGEQAIFNQKIITPTQYIKKMETVTPGNIKSLAGELFNSEKAHLAIVGQHNSDTSKLERILNKI